MNDNIKNIIDIGSKVSLAVVLMVILWGGIQGYWVAGTTYQSMITDRDNWRNLALQGAKIADAVTVSKIRTGRGPILSNVTQDTGPNVVQNKIDLAKAQLKKEGRPIE